jgi:hypothetical protein
MTDFDDLDDMLSVLRSPATSAELEGEDATVDLMADHCRTRKGTHMFNSRRSRVATLIVAGVIGFGGVAAAGPGGFDLAGSDDLDSLTPTTEMVDEDAGEEDTVDDTVVDDTVVDDTVVEDTVVEDTVVDDTVVDDTVVEDTVVPTSEVAVDEGVAETDVTEPTVLTAEEAGEYGTAEDPDPTTAFNEAYCREGNHGKTVSAVAKGEAPFEDVAVRDAAHSSCGKSTAEADDGEVDDNEVDDSDATSEPDEIVDDENELSKPADTAQTKGNGSAKVNGNGNGKKAEQQSSGNG